MDLAFAVFDESLDTVTAVVHKHLRRRRSVQKCAVRFDLRYAYWNSPSFPTHPGWDPAQFLLWTTLVGRELTVMM